jgi:hypothetical protein
MYVRNDLAACFGAGVTKMPVVVVGATVLLCLVLATGAGRLQVKQNLMEMEAKGLTLEASYSGSFSTYGAEDDEAAIAPSRHAVTVVGRFSY